MKGFEHTQKEVTMLFILVETDINMRLKQMPEDGVRGARQARVNIIAMVNNYRRELRKLKTQEPDYKEEIQDVIDAISAPDFNYLELDKEDFTLRILRHLLATRTEIEKNFGEF